MSSEDNSPPSQAQHVEEDPFILEQSLDEILQFSQPVGSTEHIYDPSTLKENNSEYWYLSQIHNKLILTVTTVKLIF